MGGVQPIRELDHFACSWKTLEKCSVPFYVHLVWKFVIIQTLICNLACPDGVLGTTSRPLISELKISVITWVSVPSPIFHSVCFPFRFSFRVSICPMRFRMIQFFFLQNFKIEYLSFNYRLRPTDFRWLLWTNVQGTQLSLRKHQYEKTVLDTQGICVHLISTCQVW